MKTLTKKALRIAVIFALIFFLIPAITNWMQANIVEGISNGVIGGLIVGVITFLISKSAIKKKITFKWWQWIFYVLGWFFGFANILFWIIMGTIHMSKNYGRDFFNKEFHRRVFIWGVVMTIFVLLTSVLFLFLSS